ncbi:MAG: GNAT family N-acetyltransferase [Pseudomonadota bacterium]
MPEPFNIRSFHPDDLPVLHDIRNAAFKPVFQSFRNLVGEDIAAIALKNAEAEQGAFLDTICSKDSSHTVFIVERGDKLVGFCSISLDMDTKVGEIDLNAVLPSHQGEGIGAAMFDHALKLMREAGMKAATVGTGGDDSHAPARRAYEKAGFGPAIPNVYMYRVL